MTIAAPTIRLLVCGSADRGDDGAPLAAVAHLLPGLTAAVREHLEIKRCVQLDVSDIVDVPDGEACIVLDTVVGIEPGDVVTMSLPELAARAGTITPRSSHALPIDQVLGIAEAVRGGLPAGVFVGIGGHWFGFGTVRSRVVRAGLARFQAAVIEAIDAQLVLESV